MSVRAQLGAVFAVPTAIIGVIAGVLFANLHTIDEAQQSTVTLTALSSTAHDIILNAYLHRFGTRGAVLTLGPSHFAMMAKTHDALNADFGALLARGANFVALGHLVMHQRMLPRR